jgi:cation diffusion facilitator family transporter
MPASGRYSRGMGHRHPERDGLGPPDRHTHDAGDRVAAALSSSADGVRATWISLVGLAATAILQLVVVLLSGSVALLADTIHNFTDALTAIPLLIAFRLGRRPPSRRFTYGYHRAEDLAGVGIVLMILASAVAAGVEAARHLAHPHPLDHVGLVLVAGVIGFAGNETVAVYRIRVGRRIGSAALVADGLHARTDGITSLGVVVSALGSLAGLDRIDAVIGLLITLVIVWTLWGAARQVLHRILDGVDEPTIALIEEVAAAVQDVEHVTEARARWVGHRLLAELSIDVDGTMSVEAGHDVADRVRDALLQEVPRLGDAAVHVDPHGHGAH